MELIAALVTATALLVAIPGPNVALIVANSLKYGFRFGVITVLGTTIGVAAQLALLIAGLAAVLSVAASAMTWIKWLGVVYLLYLAVKSWRETVDDLSALSASTEPESVLFWQGLGMAVLNPKTLLFNAAFLPQFLSTNASTYTLVICAAVYLVVLFVGDCLWASIAGVARPALQRFSNLRGKLTSSIYFSAGFGLALARIER